MPELTSSFPRTTASMRGKGSSYRRPVQGVPVEGLNGLRWFRIPWLASNDETVTPGSGKVPPGAVVMFWEPLADDDPCSIYFDGTTGTFATDGGGPYVGTLYVASKRR